MEHIKIICMFLGYSVFAGEMMGLSTYFIDRFFCRIIDPILWPNEKEKMQKYEKESKKKAKKDYTIERKCFSTNAEVVALLSLTIIDDLSDSKYNFIYPEYYVMAIIFLITIICVISVIVKSIKKRKYQSNESDTSCRKRIRRIAKRGKE